MTDVLYMSERSIYDQTMPIRDLTHVGDVDISHDHLLTYVSGFTHWYHGYVFKSYSMNLDYYVLFYDSPHIHYYELLFDDVHADSGIYDYPQAEDYYRATSCRFVRLIYSEEWASWCADGSDGTELIAPSSKRQRLCAPDIVW